MAAATVDTRVGTMVKGDHKGESIWATIVGVHINEDNQTSFLLKAFPRQTGEWFEAPANNWQPININNS